MAATSSPSSSHAPDGGSFRDPDTRVFRVGDEVLRGLTARGLADWDALERTGLLARLVGAGDLVESSIAKPERLEVVRALDPAGAWVAALRHERLPFVSYPYEWTFSMLKDAALLQLRITREAFHAGLALKDATPYNIQWRGTQPVFIDVGSFTRAREGEPWLGYRQFCTLFLYPLLLEAYKGIRFQPWLRGSLEGIQPAEARRLLRGKDTLRAGVLKHVALHARLERMHAGGSRDMKRELREAGFGNALVDANLRSLERLVGDLDPPRRPTEWSDYGATCSYSDEDTRSKEVFVRTAASRESRSVVWDLGANDGRYSRIAADVADYTVALDADGGVVDRLYLALKSEGARTILPLVGDVADPSPALGWRAGERPTMVNRGRPDLVLALAFVHHLSIGRMIPLREIVDWLGDLGGEVVVEFPDRDDPMVRRLLARKSEDAHPDYGRGAFEELLRSRFEILARAELSSGARVLYHAAPV